MKRSMIRTGCAACALLLMISSQPAAAYAAPTGPFTNGMAITETAAEDAALAGTAEHAGAGTAAAETPETTASEPAQGASAAAPEITSEEIDAFFDNSVFVGDSVMEDFRNYAMVRRDTWLGRLKFLAAVSFSTYSALRPVTAKSIHPVYAGEKRLVEDSIAMMGAKKVFMLFGPNDINITGINGTAANYVKLAERIRVQSPDVEFFIMSMPYTVKGHRDNNLYNDNIRKYNETMKNLTIEQGWGFVDIATPLADENGDLIESYSSDRDIHLRRAAYDVWSQTLRDYAKSELTKAAEKAAAEKAAEEAAAEAAKKAAGPAGPVAASWSSD